MKAVGFARRSRKPVNTSLHVSGAALSFLAGGMAVSAVVEVIDGGPEAGALLGAAAISFVVGLVMWRGTQLPERMTTASAFAAVSWTWISVCLAGALPFVFAGLFDHVDDAVFESISGFTATGSTVLFPIEGNSAGLLFWRSLTQWLGGMGIVVLAVAVLPFLGVGGLELLRAEAPGPESDKLAPRVRDTGRRLWTVYLGLTAATTVALLIAGLSAYDAALHAFTAVPTGGFSPYDASIGHFDSLAVELVLIVAMIAGAVHFTLHWRAFVHREPGAYWQRSELRVLIAMLAGGIGLITLLNVGDGQGLGRALRDSAFSVVSIGTTTGFATADWIRWVPATQLLLLVMMLSGAMAGSTSGAIKLIRLQVLWKYAVREVRRARHPRGVFALRLDGRSVQERVIELVAGFLVLYLMTFLLGTLVLTALGTDIVTSLGGAATAMGGVGPALGDAGPAGNFLVFTRPARVVLDVLMLLGRLEIFPVLLMLAAPSRVLASRQRARRSRFSPRSEPERAGALAPTETATQDAARA